MKTVEVTLQTKQGPVVAECIESTVPGLVINRLERPLGEATPDWGLWCVTHRASGYAVVQGLPNQEIAMLAAAWLGAQGYDWSEVDPETIYRDGRIGPQIKELISTSRDVQRALEDLMDLIEANPDRDREEDDDESEWNVLARFPLRGRVN